jgi:curved DNA-binding protein CbpA
LGVAHTATAEEIKHAYRRSASRYHPDKNHGIDTTREFHSVVIAYEALGHVHRRRTYDALKPPSNRRRDTLWVEDAPRSVKVGIAEFLVAALLAAGVYAYNAYVSLSDDALWSDVASGIPAERVSFTSLRPR